ncbi:MAG TPA: hypothetical protein VFO41_17475, partial [Alphaproteobacteria bacterium]|nr:hypothetical protein [Alphaproteobacteria bacterium]
MTRGLAHPAAWLLSWRGGAGASSPVPEISSPGRFAIPSSAAKPHPDPRAQAAAIRSGDRRALARAITLIESTRADHRARADALLAELLPDVGGAI